MAKIEHLLENAKQAQQTAVRKQEAADKNLDTVVKTALYEQQRKYRGRVNEKDTQLQQMKETLQFRLGVEQAKLEEAKNTAREANEQLDKLDQLHKTAVDKVDKAAIDMKTKMQEIDTLKAHAVVESARQAEVQAQLQKAIADTSTKQLEIQKLENAATVAEIAQKSRQQAQITESKRRSHMQRQTMNQFNKMQQVKKANVARKAAYTPLKAELVKATNNMVAPWMLFYTLFSSCNMKRTKDKCAFDIVANMDINKCKQDINDKQVSVEVTRGIESVATTPSIHAAWCTWTKALQAAKHVSKATAKRKARSEALELEKTNKTGNLQHLVKYIVAKTANAGAEETSDGDDLDDDEIMDFKKLEALAVPSPDPSLGSTLGSPIQTLTFNHISPLDDTAGDDDETSDDDDSDTDEVIGFNMLPPLHVSSPVHSTEHFSLMIEGGGRTHCRGEGGGRTHCRGEGGGRTHCRGEGGGRTHCRGEGGGRTHFRGEGDCDCGGGEGESGGGEGEGGAGCGDCGNESAKNFNKCETSRTIICGE